jgi:hypothetical protein
MASMRCEVDSLRREGRWLGGWRTLMHAQGIHYRELYLTAGLAWLLDPEGRHRLGNRVLHGLFAQLGLPVTVAPPVVVVTEEARPAWRTRADLVVRMPGTTLLVEAKVFSDEEAGQCDRLSSAWGPEAPTLVFLTLDGRLPLTAIQSAGHWWPLTWTQVGSIIRAAIDQVPDCAPGARELLATIETFTGVSQAMAGDEKVAFYLRHRQVIEEWAALQKYAAGELEEAIVRAVEVMRGAPVGPMIFESDSPQYPWYGIELELPAIAPAEALVALGWTHGQLLRPAGATFPYIGIKILEASAQLRGTARELLRDVAQTRHWPKSEGSWVWYEYLPLEVGNGDLDAYAMKQVEGLVAAHAVVQSALQ